MKKIYFADKKKFEKIKMNFKKDWSSKIHFLADFDNTLTKAFVDWKRTPSLNWVLREKNILWDIVTKREFELYDKFHQKEIDPTINLIEKKIILREWWVSTFDLLIEYWLKKEHIKETINSWLLQFRNGVNRFLEITNNYKIPIVIVSATPFWIYSLDEYFKKYTKNYENVSFIWNIFNWSENDEFIWYNEPIIHSFNKDETITESFPEIYNKIKERKNVILLWDSLWDHHMIDWFNYDNLLNIWYLNYNKEELLDSYLERYDVVITWDWDMSFINDFLNNILT